MNDSQHVVCVKSSVVGGDLNAFNDYILSIKDIFLCERDAANHDSDFLKVVPTTVVMYDKKLWAIRDSSTGQVSVAFGSELRINDLIMKDSKIDLNESLENVFFNHLDRKLKLDSYVVKLDVLPKIICKDVHSKTGTCLRHAHIYHLDGPNIKSADNDIDELGFLSPEELLSDSVDADMTTVNICKAILK